MVDGFQHRKVLCYKVRQKWNENHLQLHARKHLMWASAHAESHEKFHTAREGVGCGN